MKLLAFGASHRAESYNRKLAKLAAAEAAKLGAEVDFAEYSEFDMPIYNDSGTLEGAPKSVRSFGDRAAKADGIIISSPEYNWSYPGSIKNIIDWTSRIKPNPAAGKTALLMSATTGSRGGILGVSHLKTPLEALQLFVFPKMFPLGHAPDAFTEQNELRDGKQHELFISLIKDYVTFTRNLSNH